MKFVDVACSRQEWQEIGLECLSGGYRAMPVKRVWREKEEGSKRPIGKPVLDSLPVGWPRGLGMQNGN